MAEPHVNPAGDKDGRPLLPIQASDLRLGMYIHLKCSWFLHPFSRQHFLLTSENQLATIRGLGLSSILVDPEQSQPESLRGMVSRPMDSARCAEPGKAEDRRDASEATGGPQEASHVALAEPDRGLEAFQCALKQAAQTYEDAGRQLKQAMRELEGGTEDGIVAAKTVTNKLVNVLFDDALADAIIGLLGSPANDERHILHALNVSVLAMMIGHQFNLPVEELKILGIGALLHDIGEQQLPLELRVKHDGWTPAELTQYQEHPALGVQLLGAMPAFPQEALRVIESHHERIDGSGYPYQLPEEYLSLFTKIVMVVDEYDLLVNHVDPYRKLMPAEALSHLYRTARGSLAPDVIGALVRTLTVYPPGTIVELADGPYALVLTINRQERMKPLVLLYAPPGKGSAPVVIDLMRDRTKRIARRPPHRLLPPNVQEYLNMHRWTSYFLASSASRGMLNVAI